MVAHRHFDRFSENDIFSNKSGKLYVKTFGNTTIIRTATIPWKIREAKESKLGDSKTYTLIILEIHSFMWK